MKFVLFVCGSLILLGILSLGFFYLYDEKFQPSFENETPDKEQAIVIYDKKNLKTIDPECDSINDQISNVISAPQICNVDQDCDTDIHLCSVVFNQENHTKFHDLINKRRTDCGFNMIVDCAADLITSNNECIKQTCQSVKNLDPATEVRKILNQN